MKAGVAWYGRLVGTPSATQPRSIRSTLPASLKAPVLGLYGGADTGIPLDTVAAMQAGTGQRQRGGAAQSKFVVYPDAPHAFHADYRPSYRKEAAEDGWALPGLVQDARRGLTSLTVVSDTAPRLRRGLHARHRMTLAYIVLATLIGGLLSVLIAASLTVAVLGRVVQHLVSLSAGVLLGTALLHVLPEAFESQASPHALFADAAGRADVLLPAGEGRAVPPQHHHEGDGHHHHHDFDAEQAGRGGWACWWATASTTSATASSSPPPSWPTRSSAW